MFQPFAYDSNSSLSRADQYALYRASRSRTVAGLLQKVASQFNATTGAYEGTIATNNVTDTFTWGAFGSAAAGSGIALSSSRTAAMRVYSDDAGAAISYSGAVGDTRGFLSRFLVTAAQTGAHQRLAANMGQMKAVDAAWNTEQVAGLYGYVELVKSATGAGHQTYGGYGVTAAVLGCIETSETGNNQIIIGANHTFAGLAAISKLGAVGTLTQTGKSCGVYVGLYDITNWSDGSITPDKWGYGLYIQPTAATRGIFVGADANTAGSGTVVNATDFQANGFYADDGGAALTAGYTECFTARYLVSTAITGNPDVSLSAMHGDTYVTANVATAGGMSGIWGALAIKTGVTVTTSASNPSSDLAGGHFSVDLPSGATVAADSWLAGVSVGGNLGGTHTGKAAGFRVRVPSAGAWDYGIYVYPSSAAMGIYVGAATTGLVLAGAQTNAITIDTTGSTATDGHCLRIGTSATPITTAATAASAVKVYSDCTHATGYHVGGWFTSQLGADGYTSIYALRGHADVKTGITASTGAAYYVGVHGRVKVTGTINNAAGTVTGTLAQLLDGGTWTAVGNAACLWVDNQLAVDPTAGTVSMVLITQNNNSSSAIVDNVVKVYGPNIPNLFALDTCSFVTKTGVTAHGGTIGKIKVTVDDVDYYLLMSTTPT